MGSEEATVIRSEVSKLFERTMVAPRQEVKPPPPGATRPPPLHGFSTSPAQVAPRRATSGAAPRPLHGLSTSSTAPAQVAAASSRPGAANRIRWLAKCFPTPAFAPVLYLLQRKSPGVEPPRRPRPDQL